MIAFNVAGLLHEPPGATREILLRDHYANLGPDVELAGPLDADLHLQRTNRGILVRGELSAPLRRICARCTDPFVEDVAVTISEEFLPSFDPATGAPIAPDEGDDGTTQRINAHHEIELDSVFHDELVLTEPMFPLDRPDCPGLCVVCGLPLDEGEHDHPDDDIDPRLEALKAFRPDS